MNQVELLVSKNDKIDKKQIILNVMTKIFNLNQQKSDLISHFVDFIWENKLIIKNSIFECLKKKN
jgi:hypothetical protein